MKIKKIKKFFLIFIQTLYLFFIFNFIRINNFFFEDIKFHRQKIFIYSNKLGYKWKSVFTMLPTLLEIKRYANKNKQALIYVGIKKEILTWLLKQKFIDGYIFSEEIILNNFSFKSLNSAKFFINYRNIEDEREFSSPHYFSQYMWNNYIFDNLIWINFPISNSIFFLIILMSKQKNIHFFENLFFSSRKKYFFISLINRFFLLLVFPKIVFIRKSEINFAIDLGKLFNDNFQYKISIFNNLNDVLLPSRLKVFLKSHKNKFYFCSFFSDTIYQKMDFQKISKFINDLYESYKIIPLFVEFDNFVEKKYNSAIYKNIKCDYFAFSKIGIEWKEIEYIAKKALFSISFESDLLYFLFQIGVKGLGICGPRNYGIWYPHDIKIVKNKNPFLWLSSKISKDKEISIYENFIYLNKIKSNDIYKKIQILLEKK